MAKWKMTKQFNLREISKKLSLEEIGLIMMISTIEAQGLEINIDNLKEKACENKKEIQDIINKLIEKNYIEEIR